jgi:molybdenum cofactor cytidylyltransferase
MLVVGAEPGRVGALGGPDVEVVTAPGWEQGIARSLRAALDALENEPVDAVCVGLADQPLVGPEAYRRLARAHADGAEFAVCTYGDERRNPVLIGRELWPAARTLAADEGAKALMREHPPVEVPADGTGDPTDVDTPQDLAELETRCASPTNSE